MGREETFLQPDSGSQYGDSVDIPFYRDKLVKRAKPFALDGGSGLFCERVPLLDGVHELIISVKFQSGIVEEPVYRVKAREDKIKT